MLSCSPPSLVSAGPATSELPTGTGAASAALLGPSCAGGTPGPCVPRCSCCCAAGRAGAGWAPCAAEGYTAGRLREGSRGVAGSSWGCEASRTGYTAPGSSLSSCRRPTCALTACWSWSSARLRATSCARRYTSSCRGGKGGGEQKRGREPQGEGSVVPTPRQTDCGSGYRQRQYAVLLRCVKGMPEAVCPCRCPLLTPGWAMSETPTK